MSYYSGRVLRVVFQKPSESFYIMLMQLDGETAATMVKGTVPSMRVEQGTWFGFEGGWKTHPKFGKQLAIQIAPVIEGSWTPDTAESLLKGVGVDHLMVGRIRKSLGDTDFVQALSDPVQLATVPGVNTFTARYITDRWTTSIALFRGMGFLRQFKIPAHHIQTIWAMYGDTAETMLSTNPWLLLSIPGVPFSVADEIALRLRIPLDCPERILGAVLHVCRAGVGMGHLYLSSGELSSQVRTFIPDAEGKVIGAALVTAHREGSLVIDRTTRPKLSAVYEPFAYTMESESAALLKQRMDQAKIDRSAPALAKYLDGLACLGRHAGSYRHTDDPTLIAMGAVEDWAASTTFVLGEDQKDGIVNALTSPVSIITGLPGTGKTTSLRALTSILSDAGQTVLLVAPTGIAAKRLRAVTGIEAYTIHRAFDAQGGSDNNSRDSEYKGITGKAQAVDTGNGGSWGYDASRPHTANVVIVDESSMVDQHLLFRLLSCTSQHCRIVLVGDAAQLPSVGPGNCLRDLTNCGLFPTVRLTEIFRQADTSQIVFAAHDVHAGIVPNTTISKDFTLLPRDSEESIQATILQLARDLSSQGKTFQVVSPKHQGKIGVTALNEHLRELLNPQNPLQHEVKLSKGVVREGDRVMIVKNNYNLGVYNGDVGTVTRIDSAGGAIGVTIEGPTPLYVHIPFGEAASHLRLAYACTVHKMQGLEVDRIVMPIFDTFFHQLQRNLFYTAITRARKQVILVGSRTAMARAVANNREDFRNTLLTERLGVLPPAPTP